MHADTTLPRSIRLAPLVVWVALGGLAVGAATSMGQAVLPDGLGPLANSAGAWSLAAFLLSLTNRDWRVGMVLGALALIAMVAGYVVVTELRGYTAGLRLFVFWGLVAAVVGPAIGLSAAWVRGTEPYRIAAGAAGIAGVLLGEAAYGLTVIAATTPGPYWAAQAIIGVTIVLVTCVRLRRPGPATACVALTAAVAAAFYVAYTANPMSYMPTL